VHAGGLEDKDSTIGESKKNSFGSTIVLIAAKSVGNETYDVLFGIPEFIVVYEHSVSYKSDCIIFLSNDTFSEEEKKIAICAMKRLTLADYVQFCKACKELYDQRVITESLLNWVINPNFSNRYNLAKSYKNKQVVDLLTNLKNDNAISAAFKRELDNILSGKLARVISNSNSR